MPEEKEMLEKLEEMIPVHCRRGLLTYIMEGKKPGDFLTAVLRNDLKEAVGHADDVNIAMLQNYVRFLYSYAPGTCWGNPERMAAWMTRGGLNGLKSPVTEEQCSPQRSQL